MTEKGPKCKFTFLSTELWGDKDGNQKDSICIDLWESYLI